MQPEDQNRFCISDEQTLQLCAIGIFLERFHGNPRDVEWAIYQNEMFLLQSRPMTGLNAFTPWELLHEFDTAIMSPDDISTFGNIGEVLPGAVTPLTCSVFGKALDKNLVRNVAQSEASPFYSSLCRVSQHRFAFEVCNMFLQSIDDTITPENRMHGLIVFGHEFVDKKMHAIAHRRNGGKTSTRNSLPLLWDAIKVSLGI